MSDSVYKYGDKLGGDGCGGCVGRLAIILIIIVIAGFVGMWGWEKFSDWRKTSGSGIKEKIEQIERKKNEVMQSLKDKVETSSKGASDSTSPNTQRSANDAGHTVTKNQVLITLEGVTLPKTVIVTESFSLLNETGKETIIPVGSIIKIENRGSKGSLTMQINGSLFVGNELRLFGKVRLR